MIWSSLKTRQIRVGTLVCLGGVALAACGWSDSHDGWSVRLYNPGSDVVVRFTADALPRYARLPAGGEGVVAWGNGATPDGASIALLDPMSCRVVSIIEELPAGHAYVSTSWGGSMEASSYDPRDYGDAAEAGDQLVVAAECAESDPASKPLPLPSMVAGQWLNRWEMYCEAVSAGAPFGVRGEFLSGAASGCDALPGHNGGGTSGDTDPAVWNPSGDPKRLGVTWFDTACANGATVSFVPTFDGYSLHVIATAGGCAPTLRPYSAVLYLTEPIDITLVRASIERLVD